MTATTVAAFFPLVFWTGIMLVILFASVVQWFPVAGMRSIDSYGAGFFEDSVDVLHHLVLPSSLLSSSVLFAASASAFVSPCPAHIL